MITAKLKAGALAGAILTITAISAPAEAATTYTTDFTVFDPTGAFAIFEITGDITYNGPATLTNTFQDLSLADANSFLDYNWNIDSIVGSVGNFTGANSIWDAFTQNPFNPSGFPVPFEISETQLILKPLVANQAVSLFTNDGQNGVQFGNGTNGVSFLLGNNGQTTPIPTPALLPGLLGLGASLARRKKQQAEAAA